MDLLSNHLEGVEWLFLDLTMLLIVLAHMALHSGEELSLLRRTEFRFCRGNSSIKKSDYHPP